MPTLRLPLLVAALLAAGCAAVGPDYVPPLVEAPDAWHAPIEGELRGEGRGIQEWWVLLGDPALEGLLARARENAPDVRMAMARVEKSRAFVGIATGRMLPTLDAGGGFTTARGSENAGGPAGDPRSNTWDAGVSSFWELDLFGGVRRSVEAARANHEAEVEAYRDTLVVLQAEVARTYIDLRALQLRLRYARENIELQRRTLKIASDRNAVGLSPHLDVSQAETSLASTEASVPPLEEAALAAVHRLAVLLGEPPSAFLDLYAAEAPLPVPAAVGGIPVPAEALRARPDVRRAERILAARTAAVGVATADLYPRFSLQGTLGRVVNNFGLFDESESTAWSVRPAVSWSLFSGGAVQGNIAAAEASVREALAAYEGTVFAALAEVEDSLTGLRTRGARVGALRRSVASSRTAVDEVAALYESGLTDFQNVVDTQRQLVARQDELADSEGSVLQALVSLYRSLGGGWDLPPPPAPAPPPEKKP